MDSIPAPPDDVEPIPPRYWWLKRITLTFAVFFVLLLALRLWWGWEAHRRLKAEIDRIIAAGEPIYPEDFDPKEEIPHDQNAAKLLQEAQSRLVLTGDQANMLDNVTASSSAIATDVGEIQAMLDANTEVLSLLKRARTLPGLDWGIRIRTPAINSMVPSLSGYRQLAKFLVSGAEVLGQEGREGEAINLLDCAVFQGDAVAAQQSLLANLVGIANVAMATMRVEKLAPALTTTQHTDDAGAALVPTRSGLRSLIDRLVDPKPPQQAIRGAMLGERMLIFDITRSVIDGETKPTSLKWGGTTGPVSRLERVLQWPIAPLYTLNAAWGLRTSTDFVRAAEQSSFVGVQRVLAHLPTNDEIDRTDFQRLMRPLGWDTYASVYRSIVLHYRHLAMRRMAGIALAIRLYELDHGARPASLVDLVPDYVSSVPLDPFDDGKEPIRYLPRTSPPILYSIGHDGVDDGGRYAVDADGVNMERLDLVFFLNGKRPLPEPSDADTGVSSFSEAAKDDLDEQEAQGEHSDAEQEEDERE